MDNFLSIPCPEQFDESNGSSSMLIVSQHSAPCWDFNEFVAQSDEKKQRRRRRRKTKKGEGNKDVLKKRKLTDEQAASLELSFLEDQKLETARKERLASELGLEPRQVAVWFQNRRARFKCQNLEDEFEKLTSSYDQIVAQKAQLQAQVFKLSEELEDAEKELRRLRVESAGCSPATQSLSGDNQANGGSMFFIGSPIRDLGAAFYTWPEELSSIPYMSW